MMPLPIASSSDDFMSTEEASSFPLSLNSIRKKQTSNMPARVALFLFIFASLLSLHKISAQTAERERQILIEIKGAWLNPDLLRSWNLTGDHCQFAGIHCSADGFVEEINLSSSSISFPIPAPICDLKRLTFLNLSNNSIGGGFPVALYNCSNLQKLDISENFFVGELPADMEKLPINLTHLIIHGNNFTGDIPSAIGRLPSIVSLELSYNLFNGTIPAEIGNLSTLQSLMLAQNPFAPAKILPQIGNLTSLTYLWMSNMNLLGEIPGTFGKLSRLEHLDLSMNSLAEEIPPSIWMIKPLKNLYLYANRLTGEISSSIAANALIKIDLSKNKISGSIPEAFAELKSLSHLFLSYNNFSGELPLGIGRLTNLYDLRLFNNRLEGALPPEIGKHSRLWNFEVDDNMFTGGLPEHLCDGKALTCLIAFNNRLTGRFPESLGRCGTLLSVHVQNNSLTGEFPAGIWSAINLSQVIVSHNALRGTLPEELPWNLTLLEIQNNQFTGRIPSKAGNLAVFYADHNEFTGELPVGMPLIQYMSLSGNQISGEIPAGIGSLKFLSVLDLSSNLLSGRIPDAMGSMPLLNSLDLSKNKLSGEIPSSLGVLKFTYLNLSVNGLAGEIPPEFQNLAYEKSFLENPSLCSSSLSLPSTRICREIPSNRLKALILALVSVLIALIFLGAVFLCILVTKERRRRRKGNDFPWEWKLTSFQMLNFDESLIFNKLRDENLVGEGGGGKVYRVCLSDSSAVAVKKVFSTGKAGTALNQQFQTEAEILGCIRHTNIVKLLCCLSSENLKLLVYEYLPKGSLDLWLHRRRRRCGAAHLDWPTRVRIAVSSARGLCYMHHGCSLPIIHRDVKSSNILLDLEFNAKIADFGLARILEKGGGEGGSVSRVAGSYGYMAPECRSLGRVNEKVDVYSFGVVLLELVTGKEAGDGGEEEDENLTDWAWRRYKDGGAVVDEEIAEDSLGEAEIMFGMGIMCTGWDPARRPTMKMVLQVLMKLGAAGSDGEKPLLWKKVVDGMEDSDNGRVEPCSSLDSLL